MVKYAIFIPMPGGKDWFQLCKTESPDQCSAMIRYLLALGENGPCKIHVVTAPDDGSTQYGAVHSIEVL